MRILVVDDNRKLLEVIGKGLREESYAVDTAADGEEGRDYAETGVYDLIVLDIMMPKMDGIELLKKLRSKRMETPILMLTAKDAVEDIVKGLDSGADDYLVKPFSFDVLSARVRALVRRKTDAKSVEIMAGDIMLDTVKREVRRVGELIELTTKEYMILEYFMRNRGKVITRRMLEEHAWDEKLDNISNVVDVYIKRLRKKIDKPGHESIIKTIRGTGYKLRE